MALDEYKFIVPEEETNDEKIARLKSELVSMEENYYRLSQEGASAQKLDISKRKPKPRTTRRRATKSAPKSKT